MTSGFVLALELIGTFAFALSGATLGVRRDAQAREHEIFAYTGDKPGSAGREAEVSLVRPVSGVDLTPAVIEAAERSLALHIGPMAKVIIRKELPHCATFGEFVKSLAGNIDHPQQREVFLAALKRALPRR